MVTVNINRMVLSLLHIMMALTYILSFVILLWRGYKVLHFILESISINSYVALKCIVVIFFTDIFDEHYFIKKLKLCGLL